MDWTLREVRYLLAVLDAGSFTEGAAEAGVSQAAMSRAIAGVERRVGAPLLRRTAHGCHPTPLGAEVAQQARRVLAEVEHLDALSRGRHRRLRVGYAWAAAGRHTATLMRQWSTRHPDLELQLVRHNSATAGLVEGRCDAAILRSSPDRPGLDSIVVGLETRMVAYASDDPRWSRRRQIGLAEIAERTVIIDPRTGTTTGELWSDNAAPVNFKEIGDIEEWFDAIAAGHGVGITSEATPEHHTRPGVVFRPLRDSPSIVVHLAWWRDRPPSGLAELVDDMTALYRSRPVRGRRRAAP